MRLQGDSDRILQALQRRETDVNMVDPVSVRLLRLLSLDLPSPTADLAGVRFDSSDVGKLRGV